MKSNARARRAGTRGVEGMRTREKSQAIANSVDWRRENHRGISRRGLVYPFLSLCHAAPARVAALNHERDVEAAWGRYVERGSEWSDRLSGINNVALPVNHVIRLFTRNPHCLDNSCACAAPISFFPSVLFP